MTAHERMRKFETNQWYRGQQQLNSQLCMVVKAGDWLAIRGQTGHDLNGDFHGLGDPAEQTEQAFRNLAVLMAEAGAAKEDICKIKVWVRDRAFLEPVMGVIGKHMKGIPVATSEVVINGLARPYMDMEIDVYAVIDRDIAR
jgi:enamine deaminase RidA (YjgF/YER057c/UK114 family)